MSEEAWTLQCLKGRDPLTKCLKGHGFLIEVLKGREPSIECLKGYGPLIDCLKVPKGRGPLIMSDTLN